jgi:hypothetical protein
VKDRELEALLLLEAQELWQAEAEGLRDPELLTEREALPEVHTVPVSDTLTEAVAEVETV